ncbi:MAG: hypothetical protein FWD45_02015 [Coriobacteriia bacterium]|nr:hypothetical protein [Coriobacteriia bacterium]
MFGKKLTTLIADFAVQLRATSFNGFMIDPFFSCSGLQSTIIHDAIAYLDSYLVDNSVAGLSKRGKSRNNPWNMDFHCQY